MPFYKKGKYMSASSLILDIQLSYNQFTKTEKKIADFIIQNTNQVLFMSITELSESCGVADASVHRFCRTMGVKGYQEFKMKLSLSATPDGDIGQEKETEIEDSNINSLEFKLDKILQGHISALKETRMLMRMEEVVKTVEMMEK